MYPPVKINCHIDIIEALKRRSGEEVVICGTLLLYATERTLIGSTRPGRVGAGRTGKQERFCGEGSIFVLDVESPSENREVRQIWA